MISVTIYRDEAYKPLGVRMSGHAGYASKGSDVVCAAASALLINMVNSVEVLTEDEFRCDEDEETGTVDFKVLSSLSGESELLMRSLILGLEEIRNAYGSEYLEIQFD